MPAIRKKKNISLIVKSNLKYLSNQIKEKKLSVK